MAQRAVRHIGYVELSTCVDEPVCLVQCFEGRVLGLDGVDFGDCGSSVRNSVSRGMKEMGKDGLELALRSVAAEHSDRPMYLVLPARRISSSAGMDSSSGVSDLVSALLA